MSAPEQLSIGERAEAAGDYVAAASAYGAVAAAGDPELAADAHFRLGRVSWRQGRLDAALEQFAVARSLAAQARLTELRGRIENGVGAVHQSRGDYAAARRAYADAEALTGDPATRGKIMVNLAVLESIEGDVTSALEQYDRAFQLLVDHGDAANAMIAAHNRGMLEAQLDQWAAADVSFQTALALATETSNQEMIARTLVNRSEVLVARGESGEALEHCERALVIYSYLGDQVGRAEALRMQAQALLEIGDQASAEQSAIEAHAIAVRSQSRMLEAHTARLLGVIGKASGDRESGMKLLRHARAIFAELGAEREAARVADLMD